MTNQCAICGDLRQLDEGLLVCIFCLRTHLPIPVEELGLRFRILFEGSYGSVKRNRFIQALKEKMGK